MLKLNLQQSLSFFLEYIILYCSSIKQESAYTHTKERENPHEKVWTALSPQNQLIPVTHLVIYSLILSLTCKHRLVVNCFSHPSRVGGSALYQLFVTGFSAACQQDFHSISWKILRKKTQCYTGFLGHSEPRILTVSKTVIFHYNAKIHVCRSTLITPHFLQHRHVKDKYLALNLGCNTFTVLGVCK